MANNLTDYGEVLALNLMFRNTGTMPSAWYLAVYTAAPGEAAATGTEVSTSGTAYARQALTFGAPTSGAGITATTNAQTFGPATGSGFGTCTDIQIMDASTAGNALAYGPMTASKTVAAADSLVFAIGAVTVAFA